MPDFLGMMKQAAQLQSKMQAMQEELGNIEVEGLAGGGLVAVRMTAKMDVKGVKIDPSLVKPEEVEILQDLLVTAHADARRKAETVMLLELHNPENPDSVRRCTVLTRCGKSEQFYFEFRAGEGLCLTNKPEPVRKETAFTRIEDAVFSAYHAGDEIDYQPAFGSKSTFYDWRKSAVAEGKVTLADKKIYVPFVRAGDICPLCHQSA